MSDTVKVAIVVFVFLLILLVAGYQVEAVKIFDWITVKLIPPPVPNVTPTNDTFRPSPTPLPEAPPSDASLGDIWTRPFDNAVMVYVPAGEFKMGSTEDDLDAFYDQLPQDTVLLDSFWIDKYEVTNDQFAIFLNNMDNREEGGESWLDLESDGCLIEYGNGEFQPKRGYANHPVVKVSWYGARAYAEWVRGRLPSEAEWEYAARGPENHFYPWGNDEPTCALTQYSGCGGNTVPVGKFSSGDSWCGASDLAGNVGEWTRSIYRDYPYDLRDGREDLNAIGYRVFRGGSFDSTDSYVRSAFRNRGFPYGRYLDVGFRVVMYPESSNE